jgi:hypothetical protein
MTELRAVRATGPADLLALVPGLLGFHPEGSVVVMTIGNARHTFHARIDLPADDAERNQLGEHITSVAVRNGVRQLAVLLYTDDATLADLTASCLTQCLAAAGVDVVCAVRADGARWWSLGRPDERRRGHDPGTPYDVGSHPLMAQTVMEGTVVLGSRQELADSLVGSDPDETGEVARLAAEVAIRLRQAPSPAVARQRLVVEGRWVRDRLSRHCEDGRRLDTGDVARLLGLVHVSTEVRDVAWVEITQATARAYVDLWRDVVRRSPVELRAAPAALLAFAAWLSGHGALAWCAVDCAQDADPDYGLAGLLTQVLAAGMPPSEWRPVGREALSLFAG